MNRTTTLALSLTAALAAVALTWSWAQSAPTTEPRTIPYQGHLEMNGAPVDAATDLTFTLTDGSNAANTWTEVHAAVAVSGGRFSVTLGGVDADGVPRWAFRTTALDLQIGVGGGPLLPGKQRIRAVPYAVKADNGTPTGSIMPFAGAASNVPPGWVLCDGKGYDAADPAYKPLAAILAGAWGDGGSNCTGTCTFNVPDLRGQFLRGAALDLGASADPDINTRTPNGNGETAAPGSTQPAGLKSHTHPTNGLRWFDPWRNNGYVTGTGNHVSAASPEAYGYATASAQSGGVAETRPRNTSVNYIIKL